MAEVSGMKESMRQAEVGAKLLMQSEKEVAVDVPAATQFKSEIDAKIAELDAEVAALSGKENKQLRVEKEKMRSALRNQHDYIDACKVMKGLDPVHGFFVIAKAEAPAPAVEAAPEPEPEKVEKKPEKKEKAKKPAAGLSREEKVELDGLKQKIIDRKAALKEEGKSGSQINKDEEIVAWVNRLNELKEKEDPGSTGKKDDKKASKKKANSTGVLQKQKEIEDYTTKLRTEFGYSKKDISADPDLLEMKAELAKLGA